MTVAWLWDEDSSLFRCIREYRNNQNRAAFEKWLIGVMPPRTADTRRDGDGYKKHVTHFAWLAWNESQKRMGKQVKE